MYWSSQLLGRSFQKQEISQQVVTRMQDLASEFSKIFRGGVIPPDPHSGMGRPKSDSFFFSQRDGATPQHPARPASAPVLGPRSRSPSTF